MIDDINTRLQIWAEWIRRREDGGMGFPRECSYSRLQARSNTGYVPIDEGDAWQIERAVTELKKRAPLLHQVIGVHYLRTMTIEQRAVTCQCGKRTFFDRLHAAHLQIRSILCAREQKGLDATRTNTV